MTDKQPKVFVVQENPNLNYTPAERYGEVVFLTAIEFSPMKNSPRNAAVLETIETAMKHFDPSKDYLLLSGNPIIMGYVFHLAMSKATEVRVLWWSRDDRKYTEVLFNPDFIKSVGIPTIPVTYKK